MKKKKISLESSGELAPIPAHQQHNGQLQQQLKINITPIIKKEVSLRLLWIAGTYSRMSTK